MSKASISHKKSYIASPISTITLETDGAGKRITGFKDFLLAIYFAGQEKSRIFVPLQNNTKPNQINLNKLINGN